MQKNKNSGLINKDFGLDVLEVNFQDAYHALPEPYKNDSCLKFFVDINGNLCSEDDSMREYMFTNGSWVLIDNKFPF